MRWVALGAVALLSMLPAETGADLPLLFRDDFSQALDPQVWRVSLGGGPVSCTGDPCWDPDHAGVADGALGLTLDALRRSGAEVRTHEAFAWGSYEARMRAPAGTGGLLAFFTYACPPGEELDFVELPTGTRSFWTTAWKGSDCETMTDQATTTLGFDPSDGFHVYRVERLPGRLVLSVDGIPRASLDEGIGDAPQPLFLSLWNPSWLGGGPADDLVAEIDWVQVLG